MMSLDASGSLGGAVTFSKWKGRNYVRERVIPANPKSGGQVAVRASMKFLSQFWASLTAGNQATWENRADAKIISPFNAFVSYNITRWRNFNAPSQEDPAAESDAVGILANEAATAGVRSITIDIDVGTLNQNWAIAIFRDLSTGFDLTWDKVRAIIPGVSAASFVWVDTPLVPDTYYYDFKAISIEGVLGADHGEVDATVT